MATQLILKDFCSRYKRAPPPEWRTCGGNDCAACTLARIGSHGPTLVALMGIVSTRMPVEVLQRHKMSPLLEMLEGWVGTHGLDEPEAMFEQAEEIANQFNTLKERQALGSGLDSSYPYSKSNFAKTQTMMGRMPALLEVQVNDSKDPVSFCLSRLSPAQSTSDASRTVGNAQANFSATSIYTHGSQPHSSYTAELSIINAYTNDDGMRSQHKSGQSDRENRTTKETAADIIARMRPGPDSILSRRSPVSMQHFLEVTEPDRNSSAQGYSTTGDVAAFVIPRSNLASAAEQVVPLSASRHNSTPPTTRSAPNSHYASSRARSSSVVEAIDTDQRRHTVAGNSIVQYEVPNSFFRSHSSRSAHNCSRDKEIKSRRNRAVSRPTSLHSGSATADLHHTGTASTVSSTHSAHDDLDASSVTTSGLREVERPSHASSPAASTSVRSATLTSAITRARSSNSNTTTACMGSPHHNTSSRSTSERLPSGRNERGSTSHYAHVTAATSDPGTGRGSGHVDAGRALLDRERGGYAWKPGLGAAGRALYPGRG